MKKTTCISRNIIIGLSVFSIILLLVFLTILFFNAGFRFRMADTSKEEISIPDSSESKKEPDSSDSAENSLPPASHTPMIEYADSDASFSLESASDSVCFDNPADVVESVKDCVVGISNYYYQSEKNDYILVGSGSGFIVSEQGYILTNAHVVSDADRLDILLSDGTTKNAVMVGYDLNTDIAVIKLKEGTFSNVAIIGDSSDLKVGEYVLAIGNPLSSYNLYGTVSFGIVSGIAREINIDGYTNNFIQTDAALNPGNSGGPLFNMCGQVIAMNSAKAINAGTDDWGNSISSEGIGFALPINDVITIANNLIHNNRIIRPGIGVTIYTLDENTAKEMETVPGILIYSVTSNGPAYSAGIKAGDVIVKYNGEEVLEQQDLIDDIKSKSIGDTVILTVFRGGEYLDFTVLIDDSNSFNN